MSWLHNPGELVRYRVSNVSDTGFCLNSSLPLLTGTTGVVRRMLPEGHPIDRTVSVAWCSPLDDGRYAVGLHVIGSEHEPPRE